MPPTRKRKAGKTSEPAGKEDADNLIKKGKQSAVLDEDTSAEVCAMLNIILAISLKGEDNYDFRKWRVELL